MSTPAKSKRPTYVAYVVDGEGEKAKWTEVGALWAHDDSKGFNLSLKALPLDGRLVIREPKSKTEAGEGAR